MSEHLADPSSTFRAATGIAKLDAPGAEAGGVGKRAVWSGAIAPGWDIVANANGGYLLAIAARALGGALDRPVQTCWPRDERC